MTDLNLHSIDCESPIIILRDTSALFGLTPPSNITPKFYKDYTKMILLMKITVTDPFADLCLTLKSLWFFYTD